MPENRRPAVRVASQSASRSAKLLPKQGTRLSGPRISGKRRNPFCAMSGPSRPKSARAGCSRARRDGAASACARGGLGYRVRNGGGIHRRSPRLADIAGRCVRPRGDGRAGRLAEHPPRRGGGISPALAAAADSGREARNAGLALPPVPIEPWGTADPTERTPALAYALGVPRSRNPAPPNEPLAIAGEPTGALAARRPPSGWSGRARSAETRTFGADRPRRRVPPAIGRRLGAPLLSIGRRQRQRRRCHRDGIHLRSRLSDPQCRPRRQPRARKGSRVVSKGCRTRQSPGEDANRSAPRRTASRRRARRPASAGNSRKGDDRIRVVGKRLTAGSER